MAPIEKGSTVLVTGINGFIASHVADLLLERGYKVHGTVRSAEKGQWLQEYADKKHGQNKLTLFVVADMGSKGAFDEAVKGCSGVAHVASDLNFSPDPNQVIPGVLAGIRHTLEAATTESKIKRFVYTSSSTAALNPIPDTKIDFDESTWNDECVKRAWAPPPYEKARAWDVYGASKTQAEQELWKFFEEHKPSFEVNAVLPNANFGPVIDAKKQSASTAGWIKQIMDGKFDDTLKGLPPQWFVNVRDSARLHVAALTDPSITSQRIFAFAAPWTWNEILAIVRKVAPEANRKLLPPDLTAEEGGDQKDLSVSTSRSKSVEILKRNFGRDDFVGLEESIRETVESFV
ncbi:hypothetical protein AAFC00_002406 [Neodothiora populina]|uniref:NAD-dependent epimerase/dehydratase domain-containing protein n=1 Tax=Neodothiora populina TaxID=2781224 RepID=A0ABR3P738_9PEZI